MKVSSLHEEHVLLVARCVADLGRNKTVMQLIVADWQKTHNRWLRIAGLVHDTNPLPGAKSARSAEGDGRCEQILNVCVAAVNDLPNLAFTKERCRLVHVRGGRMSQIPPWRDIPPWTASLRRKSGLTNIDLFYDGSSHNFISALRVLLLTFPCWLRRVVRSFRAIPSRPS